MQLMQPGLISSRSPLPCECLVLQYHSLPIPIPLPFTPIYDTSRTALEQALQSMKSLARTPPLSYLKESIKAELKVWGHKRTTKVDQKRRIIKCGTDKNGSADEAPFENGSFQKRKQGCGWLNSVGNRVPGGGYDHETPCRKSSSFMEGGTHVMAVKQRRVADIWKDEHVLRCSH